MSLEEVLKKLDSMDNKFHTLQEDVNKLKSGSQKRSTSRNRSPRKKSPQHHSKSGARGSSLWADTPVYDKTDYSTIPQFSDNDGEYLEPSELLEVSPGTLSLLDDACTQSVLNESRKRVREPYQLPKAASTRTPRQDSYMRSETPQGIRTMDRELSRVQTFMLDTLAPLVAIYEYTHDLSPDDIKEATTAAIKLLGNASAQVSQLRKEKVITSINKSLLPLIKEDGVFSRAHPHLFGANFGKRSKEFMEQVKALRSILPAK
jgi:hypothetical protein